MRQCRKQQQAQRCPRNKQKIVCHSCSLNHSILICSALPSHIHVMCFVSNGIQSESYGELLRYIYEFCCRSNIAYTKYRTIVIVKQCIRINYLDKIEIRNHKPTFYLRLLYEFVFSFFLFCWGDRQKRVYTQTHVHLVRLHAILLLIKVHSNCIYIYMRPMRLCLVLYFGWCWLVYCIVCSHSFSSINDTQYWKEQRKIVARKQYNRQTGA